MVETNWCLQIEIDAETLSKLGESDGEVVALTSEDYSNIEISLSAGARGMLND